MKKRHIKDRILAMLKAGEFPKEAEAAGYEFIRILDEADKIGVPPNMPQSLADASNFLFYIIEGYRVSDYMSQTLIDQAFDNARAHIYFGFMGGWVAYHDEIREEARARRDIPSGTDQPEQPSGLNNRNYLFRLPRDLVGRFAKWLGEEWGGLPPPPWKKQE